jgi:hypothetical protein
VILRRSLPLQFGRIKRIRKLRTPVIKEPEAVQLGQDVARVAAGPTLDDQAALAVT